MVLLFVFHVSVRRSLHTNLHLSYFRSIGVFSTSVLNIRSWVDGCMVVLISYKFCLQFGHPDISIGLNRTF